MGVLVALAVFAALAELPRLEAARAAAPGPGEDDEAELGHGAALGLEVDGFGVEQGLAAGDDDEGAALDVGALLVPEGELAGELGVLVDACFDLEWAVDEAGFGEVVDDGGAVVVTVAAAGEPSDEVVSVGWGEGDDADELGGGLAGELHEDEVGFHGLLALFSAVAEADFRGDGPEVFAVEEDLRIGHVVEAVDGGLLFEAELGVADVAADIGRHGAGGLEE